MDPTILENFDGKVRLFPLPNVVLFPRVIQPLHIFEPRYKQMVEDALEDNRLIALCLLQPTAGLGGSTSPIYPDICIGQILQEERLPDGRFNLLLQGVSRAKIISEVNNGKLYRTAKVEILHDVPNSSVENEDRMRTRLVKRMTKWFTQQPSAKEQLDRLVNSDLSLGNLCDVFSFALPLSVDMKILLLQLVNVEDRASLLLEVIEQMTPEVTKRPSSSAPSKKYPPDFSAN
ncbi:MAG: LON peptidase substrate-binding domain-containing protein [Gemmataceae bacterium]|jgi:Lon protease-like protein|nr:LON peptidase substrate-binding domain-containing protein [Gemmataceae bacterium]MBJ7345891.1 LON peptidase substrate-binding domain-containing protein [Gemmataceae bacterium]MBJ7432280.1 LON peptidase substrate-binding domain-containing protein [Gemmataceae bacterium]MBJ7496705.1 LON peptidase substrate-binding domain-containing protein [Gemmataceae bacterium]